VKEVDALRIGDRVRVHLDSGQWRSEGWFEGTVVRIDPYTAHRSFHWVELDVEVQPLSGGAVRLISVFNPRNLARI
jgi:hypothetical protein